MTSENVRSHRADVIKGVVAFFLMIVCFSLTIRAIDLHWETRYEIAFLAMGFAYLFTVVGFSTKNGIGDS